MSTTIKLYILTLAAGLSAAPVLAQGLVASPSMEKPRFGTEVSALVEAAYPSYGDAALTARLATAARELQARPDRVTVRTLAGIERLLDLPAKTADPGPFGVDTPAANYRVRSGRAFALLKNDSYQGLSPDRYAAIEATVNETQRRFLDSLGLPRDEIMKLTFHRVMVASTVEGARDNSDGTPAVVRRGLAVANRGFGGFPIEGGEVHVSSFDGRRVDSFSLRWPVFKLHPEVSAITLAGRKSIKAEIVRRATAAAIPGQAVSFAMGVVFRPVKTRAGELVYVPAMKVVLTPQARRIDGDKGSVQTDGGLVFYADILKNPPHVANDDLTDDER